MLGMIPIQRDNPPIPIETAVNSIRPKVQRLKIIRRLAQGLGMVVKLVPCGFMSYRVSVNKIMPTPYPNLGRWPARYPDPSNGFWQAGSGYRRFRERGL